MNIKIGENIKKLRKQDGITQEKLADVFNVSPVAVCKWETEESYPDITLLFTIASYFRISIDELMGYNENVIENEIIRIINAYDKSDNKDKWHGKCKLIIEARKKYSYDYRIMHRYMYDIAGGYADNDPEILNKNSVDLLDCCNKILDGCNDDKIRIDAITLKAKILHAEGKTEEALNLLNNLPSLYHSSNQRKEQLFNKGTLEFYNSVDENIKELMSLLADKLPKSIIYNMSITNEEKIKEIKVMGKAIKLACKCDESIYFKILRKYFWGRVLCHPAPFLLYSDDDKKLFLKEQEESNQ